MWCPRCGSSCRFQQPGWYRRSQEPPSLTAGTPPSQPCSRQRITTVGAHDVTHPRHLPTAGPLGAAGLTAGAGHGDLRHRMGLGRRGGRGAQAVRPLRRAGRQLPRHRRHLHRRQLRASAGRVLPRQARAPGAGDEVHDAAPARRPEFRGRAPQEPVRLGARQPSAARHGLHRSALPARVGLHDTGRGDPAGPGRSGAAGQGLVRRRLQRPGLAGVAHADHRRSARLVPAGRAADRVQPGRARRGA
ncbi:hypothetical protein SGPA1_21720 [Streptomyces misionensis JCM 4497]